MSTKRVQKVLKKRVNGLVLTAYIVLNNPVQKLVSIRKG